MKKTIFILAICFVTISLLSSGYCQTTKPVEKSGKMTTEQPVKVEKKIVVAKVEYTCPMHPEVIKDKPGKCPKCGMNLVKKEAAKKTEPKK
jgi:hypothetical protein